jgi:ethanolamine kinase
VYQAKFNERVVLCRVNGLGTEDLIDREKETRNMTLLSKHNLGPKVYFTFKNGFSYAYLPGRPLRPDEMSVYSESIAKQMAAFHRIPIQPEQYRSNVFNLCHKWFDDSMYHCICM